MNGRAVAGQKALAEKLEEFRIRPIYRLMSAISSVNPGVADLFNWLSSTGSTAATSALSSPSVQSALQGASPGDLVLLSQQALQLQQAGSLFTSSDSSETSATPESLLLQALTSSIAGSTTAGSTTAGSTTAGSTTAGSTATESTAAATTSAFALELAYQLFGTNSNSGSGSGSYSFVG
jgi:hypothetical protein